MPMYATRSRAAADRQLVILDPATYEFPDFQQVAPASPKPLAGTTLAQTWLVLFC